MAKVHLSLGAFALLVGAVPAVAATVVPAHSKPEPQRERPAPQPELRDEASDLLVGGLGISALLIVGLSARRRQPRRSVTS